MSSPPASGQVSALQAPFANVAALEDVEPVGAVPVRVARVGAGDDVLTARPRHQHVRGRRGDVVVVPEERRVAVAELLVVERVADAGHASGALQRRAAVRRAGVPRLDALIRVRSTPTAPPTHWFENGTVRKSPGRPGRPGRRVAAGVVVDDVQLPGVRVDVAVELVTLRLGVRPGSVDQLPPPFVVLTR